MRDIKFRAKRRDNNEWIYGYYVKLPHPLTAFLKDYIVVSSFDEETTTGKQDFVLIRAETLGQYTGLKSKNGKEIYEGDILNFYDKYEGKIVFRIGSFFFEEKSGRHTPVCMFNPIDSIIVGNIHEREEKLV